MTKKICFVTGSFLGRYKLFVEGGEEWACWLAAILIGSARPPKHDLLFCHCFWHLQSSSSRKRFGGLLLDAGCSSVHDCHYCQWKSHLCSQLQLPCPVPTTHQQSPTTCWYLVSTKFGEAVLLGSLIKEFREPEQVSLLCREPIVICT